LRFNNENLTVIYFRSFKFEWPRFSVEFHDEAKQLLDNALNKGDKPPILADRIEVIELEMGTEVSVLIIL
jgi:hypothetical protein